MHRSPPGVSVADVAGICYRGCDNLSGLEPLYENGLEDVTPGSSCIANAYTSNPDELQKPGIGTGRAIALHVVDAVGLVHAMLLRIQALLLPIQTLVFGGH